jgi:type IV secretion system protein VirD4
MQRSQRPNPVGLLILGGLYSWGAWETQGWLNSDLFLVPVMLAFFAVLAFLRAILFLLLLIPKLIFRRRMMKPTDRAGSAAWATLREIKKAGLYKRQGFLAGVHDKKAIFVDVESSGLVLSPAGGGKTVTFVIPALCHNPDSMFVPDLKGTLACMTAKLRQKRYGHEILCVNPGGLYQDILGIGARYNPLQILIDDWNNPEFHSQLFSDAQSIAKQLCQDPPTQGENQYFRNGSRKFLMFVCIYLVIIGGNPTLAGALCLLSDKDALLKALQDAQYSAHLDGDLARLAKDLLTKFDSGDQKQIESFREGAVQALEVFSPSGKLAECTSTCDFRFSDLKKKKMTVYLLADPTRMNVYAPWLGLLSWCALTELIRTQNGQSVCFLCDEITNFKIEGLPSLLTLAREFKIVLWLIVQELEQWAHVYGRESLETLLSQTEVKIIMGARSHKTCQLVSDMLGESTIKALNHNIGASVFDEPTRSLQEMPRRLMTADEVRRTTDTILFVRNHRPVRLSKIGYHEIKPWSKWIGINPLFGKPFKGKTRLRL